MVFAIDSGLLPIVIEFDALDVVSMINFGTNFSSDISLVVGDIRDCLYRVLGGSISFVSRKVNVVAHNLSKYVLSIGEDSFWMESYPPCVKRSIQNDRSF